jgi:hypothetical protein
MNRNDQLRVLNRERYPLREVLLYLIVFLKGSRILAVQNLSRTMALSVHKVLRSLN